MAHFHCSSSVFDTLLVMMVAVLVAVSNIPTCHATGVMCDTTKDCEVLVQPGSECGDNGYCTNPFYKQGCLARMLPKEYNWQRTRVCGSEDPKEAELEGHCRPSPFPYTEVRISSQNWESGFFGTWILQILLGEVRWT